MPFPGGAGALFFRNSLIIRPGKLAHFELTQELHERKEHYEYGS